MDIETVMGRLERAMHRTTWQFQFGRVPLAQVDAVEAAAGLTLDEGYRFFLGRTLSLENCHGDVFFLTARDLLDPTCAAMRRIEQRRRAEVTCAAAYPEALASVRGWWRQALPFLCSVVDGEDFLAIDHGRAGAPVVEIWDDAAPGDPRRACSSSFTQFLASFVTAVEMGPLALHAGWRYSRRALEALHEIDPRGHEPLVRTLFETDFAARSPISRPPPPPAPRTPDEVLG